MTLNFRSVSRTSANIKMRQQTTGNLFFIILKLLHLHYIEPQNSVLETFVPYGRNVFISERKDIRIKLSKKIPQEEPVLAEPKVTTQHI